MLHISGRRDDLADDSAEKREYEADFVRRIREFVSMLGEDGVTRASFVGARTVVDDLRVPLDAD